MLIMTPAEELGLAPIGNDQDLQPFVGASPF